MSERSVSAAEQDPHFAEAVQNVVENAARILEHYKDFAADNRLELAVYLDRDKGHLEPSEDQRLYLYQVIDLTDDPATAETIKYSFQIVSHRNDPPHLSRTRTDIEITLPLGRPEAAQAEVKTGNIHTVDNALHNFIEAKGL
jgi:hypothetical protein